MLGYVGNHLTLAHSILENVFFDNEQTGGLYEHESPTDSTMRNSNGMYGMPEQFRFGLFELDKLETLHLVPGTYNAYLLGPGKKKDRFLAAFKQDMEQGGQVHCARSALSSIYASLLPAECNKQYFC